MSAPVEAVDLDRHNREIHENRQHWARKPALQSEYARFYALIADRLVGRPDGPVLECGSGMGTIKEHLPEAITSDLFPNPWLDRQEDVYALRWPDASVAAVVLFDVFHHLQYPGTALRELHRVLKPGGRVVILDPAAGLFGRLALGLFHHEPLALKQRIEWDAPADFEPARSHYYAAQGNAWRIFGDSTYRDRLAGWQISEPHYLPALPWLLTGGFRGPNLIPGPLRHLARLGEAVLRLAPKTFASRMLVVLEKPITP